MIEGTTKAFYRNFRINKKVIRGTFNIIDPLSIGFGESLERIVKDYMSNLIIDILPRFVPANFVDHYTIPVVINPSLQTFQAITQKYLMVDNVLEITKYDW